jgi:hypothetical protein
LTWLFLLLFTHVAHAAPLSWRHAGATWRSPTLDERHAVIEAVTGLAQSSDTCPQTQVQRARRRLADVGMKLHEIELGGRRVIVVQEGEEVFGAGMLALRCGAAVPIVWQAPHPFFDRHSGDIILRWFTDGKSRAAMWATVHRYRATADELQAADIHPADVTREPGSLFHAMTVALARADNKLRFIQVHGYADSTEPRYRAILSTGDRSHPLSALGERMNSLVGPVGIYGVHDVRLAGTRNVQGRALADVPGRFIHVELSATTRDAILDDSERGVAVGNALEAGPW